MSALAAVVFDLDGTLIDSAPDIHSAVNRLLAAEGRVLLSLDAAVGMIGDGAAKLVERAFAATGAAPASADLPDLTRRFLAYYQTDAVRLTRLYDGARETLAQLRGRDLALGICTNKPEAATHEILESLRLAPLFDAVVGGDSLDGIRKPDPRALLAVLERLHVAPAAAIMVGDNANDVQSARAVGMPVVVRAGGYSRTPAAELGADAVFDDFGRLPDILSGLR
ncbi:MAG: phosphoglycolate phosphatase [Rhodospirillales bacterium]|nr:MAG: phosphoglycolate phosphatase [Rhodospirillales bacterium]